MKSNWIYTLLLCLPGALFAQNTTEEEKPVSGSSGGYQKIERGIIPKIQDAKKLSIPIQKEKIRVKTPTYEYSITPSLFEVNPYYQESLQPISLGDVKMSDLIEPYMVLGIGNYRNALFDFYYSSDRDRDKIFDIRLGHRSGKAPARYSGFGNNQIELNGEKVYRNHSLKGGLDFDYRRIHNYGFYSDSLHADSTIDPNIIKNDFMNVGIRVDYDNYKNTKAKHQFGLNLSPYYFYTPNGNTEWAAALSANINERLNETSFLGFKVGYDYNGFYNDEGSLLRNIIRVGAAYNLKKDAFTIKAGFSTASDNSSPPGETAPSENSIYFFPDVNVRFALPDNYLVLYAGLNGDLQKNSLRSISRLNPFVITDVPLKNTVERLKVSGGLKGSFTNEFNFHLGVLYRNMDNMLLFQNLGADNENFFTPTYSGNNSNVTQVSAELQYKQHERWMINTKANYYSYSLVNVDAWNLPTFDLKLSARYNFQEKIIAKAEVYALNSRIGVDLNDNEYDMPGAVDISLGADYEFNSKTYLFASINNLLHQKYMVWNGFPVQGFHLMMGVKMEL